MKVAVINLGCPKNRVDAEIILAELAQTGFEVTGDPDYAEAVIVNTCAFLEAAIEESTEVIEAYQARRRKGDLEALLVTGCLPQRHPRELIGMFPWVDAFLGLDKIPDIPRILRNGTRKGEIRVCSPPKWNPDAQFARMLSTPSHYAYLRLTEGCSNLCSYCTIPAIRGSLRIRSPKDIFKEAAALVDMGVQELVLIAQDTAAHPDLEMILNDLDALDGLRWIRLLYAHPRHLTEGIIEKMAASSKILNYVDMPVQHLADTVLERMNRKVTHDEIETLVNKARSLDPDFTLRTAVIVGFPKETEEEFSFLLNGLKRLRFTNLGIFVYSAEEGTEAAEMEGQIPEEVKEERARQVAELAERLRAEEYERMKGGEQEGVIDFTSEEAGIGRLWKDAPEIDRIVEIKGSGFEPGRFGKFEITGGKDDRIFARWIEPV
ncbi:30S ribosomal protein S12 methylthiotransferase RimO [candidate division WOR-3 bacterium]|nr:30S ribosomal protein S12 methylthiotransferase RimO [candidate division WOR-3 bacterium]